MTEPLADISEETTILANRARVWRALINPEHVKAWLGCLNFSPVVGHVFYMQQDSDKRERGDTSGATHCEVLRIVDERELDLQLVSAGDSQDRGFDRAGRVRRWEHRRQPSPFRLGSVSAGQRQADLASSSQRMEERRPTAAQKLHRSSTVDITRRRATRRSASVGRRCDDRVRRAAPRHASGHTDHSL